MSRARAAGRARRAARRRRRQLRPRRRPAAAGAGARRAADASFVDLGSMIFEESAPRDTRMRIDRREPQDEDEQREFKEILEQFKRGIEENLETDDYQAHYDLGVAFKEMGLLDEAIAEFQKALRAPEGRLRTSEALGMAFFEKGQFAVSEAVLRRAVDDGRRRGRGQDRPDLLARPRARGAGQGRATPSPATSARWRWTSGSWT